MRTAVVLLGLCLLLPGIVSAQPSVHLRPTFNSPTHAIMNGAGRDKARDSDTKDVDSAIKRDAGRSEVPDRTPQSDAVFDTLFAYRGERVTGVIFVSGFTPGASRNIAVDQLQRLHPGGYLIGATDPQRFDGKRNTRNLSQLNNYSLGLARANWVNAKTGYRSTVLATVIINDRRGVYQVFTAPVATPVTQVTPLPQPPPVFERPYVISRPAMWTIEPVIGWHVATGSNYHMPIIGVRLSHVVNGRVTSLTGYEGRRFAKNNDDQVWSGEVEFGRVKQPWSWVLGAEGDWRLDPTYHYTERTVFGKVGVVARVSSRSFDLEARTAIGFGNRDTQFKNEWLPAGSLTILLGRRF